MEKLKDGVYVVPEIKIIDFLNSDIITASNDIEENLSDGNWQP